MNPADDDENSFRPPDPMTPITPIRAIIGITAATVNTPGTTAEGDTTDAHEYYKPRIIRDRNPNSIQQEFAPEDLEGDQYFEPPIVRKEDLKTDERVAALFSEYQKCGRVLLSDLIQALDSM